MTIIILLKFLIFKSNFIFTLDRIKSILYIFINGATVLITFFFVCLPQKIYRYLINSTKTLSIKNILSL